MKIKDLINYERMVEFLNADMTWFEQFGTLTHTPDGMMFIFRNMGANILSVAHLDSVNHHNHFYVNEFAGDDIVFSTHLDDRLGAYIILELLPQMGIHADILLTEGEEIGKSTAAHFTADKQYRWMFSFDRRGTDAVHYRYTMRPWILALEEQWGRNNVTRGSNSDIDYLHKLGCCGVNVGTGYHQEHDLFAHANMTELKKQLGRFLHFYHTNKRTRYEYVPGQWQSYTYKPANPPPPAPATPLSLPPSDVVYYQGYGVDDEYLDMLEFNPYEGMVTDQPLDITTYTDKNGVITQPEKCAFCLDIIRGPQDVGVFMGICVDCERFAVICVKCGDYYCRPDEPTEDMGEELYFGICSVCKEDARITGTDEHTRLQNPGDEWREDDGSHPRDEGPAQG